MPEKIIAGGGLVINEKNELLMIFRKGKWDLPKGKLDDNETIEECAVREVREETGLKHVKTDRFIGITYHNYNNPYKKNKATIKETHWFAMLAESAQKLVPQKEEDIEKIEWADEKSVNKYLQESYPNIIEIIEKWKAVIKEI